MEPGCFDERPYLFNLMLLKARLDALYQSFDCVDSATDPIQIVRRFADPADREVVGFCAAALAFGRVASVLQSIERLIGVMGASPAAYVRRFDVRRDTSALKPIVHRWTTGADLAALVVILQRMLQSGSIEEFFLEGYDPNAPDISGALESFSTRALATDLRAVYGRRKPKPGVAYLFSRPSRAVAARPRGQAHCAARYPCHSRRQVFTTDAVYEPGMEDGGGYHGIASRTRSARSGEVRLFAMSSRDGRRVRIQPRAG
jgi:hypothetical protein